MSVMYCPACYCRLVYCKRCKTRHCQCSWRRCPKKREPMDKIDKLEAPITFQVRWCPVCGRDDRVNSFSFRGQHYALGKKCEGVPVTLEYSRAASSATDSAPAIDERYTAGWNAAIAAIKTFGMDTVEQLEHASMPAGSTQPLDD